MKTIPIINITGCSISVIISAIALFRLYQTKPKILASGIAINAINIATNVFYLTYPAAYDQSDMIPIFLYFAGVTTVIALVLHLNTIVLENYSVLSTRITKSVLLALRVVTGTLYTTQLLVSFSFVFFNGYQLVQVITFVVVTAWALFFIFYPLVQAIYLSSLVFSLKKAKRIPEAESEYVTITRIIAALCVVDIFGLLLLQFSLLVNTGSNLYENLFPFSAAIAGFQD